FRNRALGRADNVTNCLGRWLVVYGAAIVAVALMYVRGPTGFLPEEDQGIAYVQVQTPAGTTQAVTEQVLQDVSQYLLKQESAAVDSTFEVEGTNFAARAQ